MLEMKNYQFWFCTGSQDLYGQECLDHVAEHSKIMVDRLNKSGILPYEVVWKPTLLTNAMITCKILDPGTSGIQETAAASAHTV